MKTLQKDLLQWYAKHARVLPWRGHSDPYAVWVSEIMLQQTRVETVLPYFARWLEKFPSIAALAEASEQEVLSAWEGLGYYSRARNLHKAARQLMAEHGGRLPETIEEIRRLPGVGAYTAGAIASMAFGLDEAALDGNIRRVLARLFDLGLPADGSAGLKELWRLAREILPSGRAGDHNQALMDLGATICLPKAPLCGRCPLGRHCLAFRNGNQAERPLLKKKMKTPHYLVAAAILRRGKTVLLAQRPVGKLLGGMWEYPGGKVEPGESLAQCLVREIHEELDATIRVGDEIGVYQHAYTHFKITVHAFLCELTRGEPRAVEAQAITWARLDRLDELPMGKVDRLISRAIAQKPITISK